jgi:putative MATE family efflux protein
MLLFSLFNLIDTFFIARLGSESLAALTMVIPVQVLISSMASATGVGITSLIGRSLGSQDIGYADNAAWHGVILSIFYSIVLPLIGFHCIEELLLLFGCSNNILALSKEYMEIILAGSIFTFVPIILCSAIQGEGNTLLPVLVSIVGIILNVILDPILIFGAGPIKGMGLAGAALAGVLAQVLCTILAVTAVVYKKAFLSWSPANFKPSLQVLADIHRVALPSLVMELTAVFVTGYINKTLASFSFTAVAAFGVFMRVRAMLYMPVFGLTQGTMPIASFAYGAKKYDRVKETIIKASLISFVYMVIAWYVMQFHPLWIIKYFSQDPTLTSLGINCMHLASLFVPLIGPVIILSTILQAIGKGFTAMFLSLCRQFGFFLPLLMVLPDFLGLNGVWLAFSLTELLVSWLALFFFLRLWKQLQIKKNPAFFLAFGWDYVFRRIYSWLRW